MRTGLTMTTLDYLGFVGSPRNRGSHRDRGPAHDAPRARRTGGGRLTPWRPLTWLGLAQTPVAISGHPRIRERALEHLRQRRRRDDMVTASLGLLLAIVLLAIGVTRSPLLDVEAVSLIGVSEAQEQIVSDHAGVTPGTNALDVDLATVAERVEELPWVVRATARRRLPSTVEVRVAVARPVVRTTVGETMFLLNADGVVVESVPVGGGQPDAVSFDRSLQELPTVEVVTPPRVGDQVDGPAVQAAAVAAAMPRVVSEWVVGYAATEEGDVDAHLRIPTDAGPAELVAHLGRPEDIAAKAAALVALVDETVRNGMTPEAVDLRIPDRPIVRT